MEDKNNAPQNNSDEINLIQLFGFFEQKIKAVFGGIFSIFKGLFSLIVHSIKALQKNVKILLPLLAISLATGFYFDKQEPEYSSEMLVKPYFDAKYQLYANIEYYNSLLADDDYSTLSSIFGIDVEQAEKIKEFLMYPGPETENQLRKEYYKFIEDITLTQIKSSEKGDEEESNFKILDVSFKEFVEGRSIYSSDKFMIKAISTKKDIFKHLEKGLNNSFDNEYSTKSMKKRDSVIILRTATIEKAIEEIEALEKVYIEAFKENVKATASQIRVGEEGFALADSKVETKEFELLEKKNQLYNELNNLQEGKVTEDTFFDVISSFPEIGKLEKVPFYFQKKFLFPLISLVIFIFGLMFIKAYKFVEAYE